MPGRSITQYLSTGVLPQRDGCAHAAYSIAQMRQRASVLWVSWKTHDISWFLYVVAVYAMVNTRFRHSLHHRRHRRHFHTALRHHGHVRRARGRVLPATRGDCGGYAKECPWK